MLALARLRRLRLGRAPSARSPARALALGSAIALAGCGASPPAPAPRPSKPPAKVEIAAPRAPLTPAQIAARSTPAVVSVRHEGSLGTGFVVREDGWIVTNLHVVLGAQSLLVVLPDKSEHPVTEVIGFDRQRDLVVLRIEATRLPTLALGDSDAVRAGDPVVAIGHPLGLEDTVSNGLVSAVRVVDPSLTVLQISAPIAPGSSGGPLLNDRGEVIGVAAAVSREGQLLNFGVPVIYLKDLIEDADPVPFGAFARSHAAVGAPSLPKVQRSVPHHALSLLRGCTDADLRTLALAMESAIEVGAPLYNGGNFAACFHVYEGASRDAQRKLGPACLGPRKALGEGERKAAGLPDAPAQAWAMRDAFDGLLDVIVRRLRGDAT